VAAAAGRIAAEPGFAGTMGVARREITPPPGVPTRSWGPATNEVATGVHRPLTLTAVAFVPDEGEPFVLVAADLGWFKHPGDELHVRQGIVDVVGGDRARALLHLSHTHAAPTATLSDGNAAGQAYLDDVRAAAADAARDAIAEARPATLTTALGRCSLAANRDFPVDGRYVVGFNPDADADDTVVVGRITADDGTPLAILVNYACHPTTLAWENRLLSPDYVGAAREVLEGAFDAPALFLQGASGELAPRDDYVGDTAVADRNGRQLGHAAAAAIENLPPAGTRFVYTGIVASGANLGTWKHQPIDAEPASERLAAQVSQVPLQRKEDLGVVESLSAPDSIQEQEKALRRRFLSQALGDGPVYAMPVWTWRLGDALLVAIPNEPYSVLQVELRERFAGTPLLVLGVTNRTMGYLSPAETYGTGLYQEQQSPFAPGCLEQTIEAAATALEELRTG